VSRRFLLGRSQSGPIECALSVLVDTRLLIQANSGGGKSWCLRRLLEQTHGAVQHLVIDPEGEFSSLRERFDYVLAARAGGDTAADPRSARLLAERLLELGASAILDIYELKAHERITFVRHFLETLVDAPKKLWHPALVVVDEAHVFCPEKGEGEAESAAAVVDLMTRGRKRGFCGILATQRLAKLRKDAAAEANNKLIGRTGLDVDMKRAGAELGFAKDRLAELRKLEPGSFFAFGPALSGEVVSVRTGSVKTTHPKAGARLATVAPPATAKVRALLPKLADLPAEAEQRQKTIQELKAELQQLKRELRARPTVAAPVEKVKRVEVPILKDSQLARLEGALQKVEASRDRMNQAQQVLVMEVGLLRKTIRAAATAPAVHTPTPQTSAPPHAVPATRRQETSSSSNGSDLNRGERKILVAIAQHSEGVDRTQLTVLTGYKRSSRDTYLQRLSAAGLVDTSADLIRTTEAGLGALGPEFEPLPTGDALREHWMGKLPGGERRVFEMVITAWPNPVDREAISETTGYKRSSRDTYLQRLKARRLVVETGPRQVRAAEGLFS